MNRQSRDTGNIEHKTQDTGRTKHKNTTQKTKKMSNMDSTKTMVKPGARVL